MDPTFVLAQRFAEASLHRIAYSALPTAPVQPHRHRRRRLRSPAWADLPWLGGATRRLVGRRRRSRLSPTFARR